MDVIVAMSPGDQANGYRLVVHGKQCNIDIYSACRVEIQEIKNLYQHFVNMCRIVYYMSELYSKK